MSVIDMTIVDIDQVIDLSVGSDAPVSVDTNEIINTGGTMNYNDLTNKPMIEGVALVGDKTYEELNLSSLSNAEIEALLDLSI